tara:strand:- start:21 stop:1100 length:1080 start_codon:yes stop_codon:yes gene_type:complete
MFFFKTISKIALVILLTFSACTKDSNDTESYAVPTSYNFSNASYSGQTDRLNMLAEMETEMKKANNGLVVDAAILKAMYVNEQYTWTSSAFEIVQPTKDLMTKTFPDEQANLLALIDELAELSLTGNTTTSIDGENTYLFNENGFEPIQLISKGIMGSCFYFQGTSVYLSEEKMDVSNDISSLEGTLDYTDMQHHWDESFGYFGAPISFSNANTSGGSFWAKYATKTIEGGLTTIDNIINDGFILGRAAIDNNDVSTRNEAIATIQTEWEMVTVCAALHYLNAAIDDIADPALRNHSLSEATAFISAISFNAQATISGTAVDNIINMLGTNLNLVTPEMINNTRTALAGAFNISNATDY